MRDALGTYILDDRGDPVPVDMPTWSRWFGTAKRHVVQEHYGDRLISTVFLGLDHQFGKGRPLLYETLVFDLDPGRRRGQTDDRYPQRRYSTRAEAIIGHAFIAALVRAGRHQWRSRKNRHRTAWGRG